MKRLTSRSPLASGVAGLLTGASLTAMAALSFPSHAFNPEPTKAAAASSAVSWSAAPASLADLVERVSPSVVQILVRQPAAVQRLSGPGDFDLPPEFRYFFGPGLGSDGQSGWSGRELPDRMGAGSGFFVEGGYIVTNNHVVDNAKKLKVRLDDGAEIDGELVGTDDKTDLAVVKVDAKYARQGVQWGDSDRSRVGDNVFTIGAPFSLGNSVTAGIISARGRDISSGPYDDYFQIDAPINPGNSGGPMFNSSGQVIGVNTAIYSPSGGNVGIGFSIPSDQAQAVVRQIIDRGYVERGWLGVSIQKVTPEIASSLGLKAAKGALVADVTEDSPAAKAGLKPQDVVIRYGERTIASMHDLTQAVADTKPGSTRQLEVLRNGRKQTINVRVEALEKPAGTHRPGAAASSASATVALDGLGLVLADDDKGAVIADIDVNSAAADVGLRAGDRILTINDQPVTSAKNAQRALADASKDRREAVLVQVERNGAKLFVGVPLAA